MRFIKIGLVCVLGLALSIGFAQGDKKAAPGKTMSHMAKHHGKMMMKSTGHAQAKMAMHHGKMMRHHRHHGKMMGHMKHHRHHMMAKGHMMMKKGEAMEKKGEKMENAGSKMMKKKGGK